MNKPSLLVALSSLACASFAALASATGCASSSAADATHGTASSTSAATAEPAVLSGTWAFALAASDVAAPLRARCAKSSNDDAAKAAACWEAVAKEAASEKIRFSRDGGGRDVWTSFETDGAKESIHVEVPVELAADGPGHVLAKVAGTPRGALGSQQFAKSSTNVMRIEVVNARTIAMMDPKKGRLVYTKE